MVLEPLPGVARMMKNYSVQSCAVVKACCFSLSSRTRFSRTRLFRYYSSCVAAIWRIYND